MPAGRAIETVFTPAPEHPVPGFALQLLLEDGQLLQTADLLPLSVLDSGINTEQILRWFNNASGLAKANGETNANDRGDWMAHVGNQVEYFQTDSGEPAVVFNSGLYGFPASDGRPALGWTKTAFTFFHRFRVSSFPAITATPYDGPSIWQEQSNYLGFLYYNRAGTDYFATYDYAAGELYQEVPGDTNVHTLVSLGEPGGITFLLDGAMVGIQQPVPDVVGSWTMTMGNVGNGPANAHPPSHVVLGGVLGYTSALSAPEIAQNLAAIALGNWS